MNSKKKESKSLTLQAISRLKLDLRRGVVKVDKALIPQPWLDLFSKA